MLSRGASKLAVLALCATGSAAFHTAPPLHHAGRMGALRSSRAATPIAMAGLLPSGFSDRVASVLGLSKLSSKAGAGMYPIVGDEKIMSKKAHGTSEMPVQKDLRWNCDFETADRICNFNRHYAEYAGYWETTSFLKEVDREKETTYYDSVTGKPLFIAPRGRSFADFEKESKVHGWPSFRDEEVVWENMRCLANGESVSVDGTHLGHNLPDRTGNRYCINLVSVAGKPTGA